jgi:hypothetical protein
MLQTLYDREHFFFNDASSFFLAKKKGKYITWIACTTLFLHYRNL